MQDTDVLTETNEITFEQFRQTWIDDVLDPNMSSLEKGRRFARKLIEQWLDVDPDDPDLTTCDGSGDGGIDIAYLRLGDVDEGNTEVTTTDDVGGDVWYIVQSKYGTSFQGRDTIVENGAKAIRTIAGENNRLSEITENVVAALKRFTDRASEQDRIVFVFATDRPISEGDRQALEDVRSIGRERFGAIFDVEDVSLATIWEKRDEATQPSLAIRLSGNFVEPSAGLRVGTLSLVRLYEFLKEYQQKTGNLDQLYERNVRQFLGGRRKINKGIAATLTKSPHLFGLFNNGITIVVTDYQVLDDGEVNLYDPYVVNGCQTTKTIWQVLRAQLDSGGTGENDADRTWVNLADRGVVVTKIVKSDSAPIDEITRYTNSQNAVREQDFLALRSDFRRWADAMASRYSVFLEIQRGGWDARKTLQDRNESIQQFNESAYAFDLLKVIGAGWLKEPGHAFGRSAPFLPGGTVFRRLTDETKIDVDDLYAAYRLRLIADGIGFGRGSSIRQSRRQTRFMFYWIFCEFLEDVLRRNELEYSPKELTSALLKLLPQENEEAIEVLVNASLDVVDEYMDEGSDDCVFKESSFTGDLNTWLKNDRLGKGGDETYHMNSLLSAHKIVFRRGTRGQASPFEIVTDAINTE